MCMLCIIEWIFKHGLSIWLQLGDTGESGETGESKDRIKSIVSIMRIVIFSI